MKWSVSSIMIINEYKETIDLYIESVRQCLKENLELIYIIGSSATKDIIVNWSDIDCIIVLNKYKKSDIDIIKKISNSFDIKIGNTIYSKKEFEMGLIDPKTYYYLLLYKEKNLKIQYRNDNLLIPNVNRKTCSDITKTILTIDLHNCKRLLTYEKLDDIQVKTLFKKIYVIMKSMLIINNYKPKNYNETFKLFHEVSKFEYFDYLEFIKNFKSRTIDEVGLKNYALRLVMYVVNEMS